MSPLPEFIVPADHPASRENREAQGETLSSPIEAVAGAMVARLKDKLPGSVVVDHFPDKPEEFDFPDGGAAALVIWDGSGFDQGGPVGQQGTREALRMGVALLVRSLRGPSGAYVLKHEIQRALHGYSFAGATGLRPIKADLERQAENVFQYLFVFEGTIPAIPDRIPAGLSIPRSMTTERL